MSGFWCIGLIVTRCFADLGGGVTVECPPLRTWSAPFQKQLAAELHKAPRDSAMARVTVQAIGDRDIARACRAAKARQQ